MNVSVANIDNPDVANDKLETPDDISRSYSRVGLTPLWQGQEPHMDEDPWNPSAPIPGETLESNWTLPVRETFSTFEIYSPNIRFY